MSKFKVGDKVRIIGAESQLIFQYPYILTTHSAMGDMVVTRLIEVAEESPFINDKSKTINHCYVDIERCDGKLFTKCVPNTSEAYQSKFCTINEDDLELITEEDDTNVGNDT